MQTSVLIYLDLSYINDTYINICILTQKIIVAHCDTASNCNTLQHNYMKSVSLHTDPVVEGLFCKRVLCTFSRPLLTFNEERQGQWYCAGHQHQESTGEYTTTLGNKN